MSKYSETFFKENLNNITRDSDIWNHFVCWQKERIIARLNRYNSIDTAKTQLEETGNISHYQKYKINTVSKYLLEAIKEIELGKYGLCISCGNEININRLFLVPGALRCVDCDNNASLKR
jgi:RNA polymerase-binding transcription factor DksA